MQKIPNQRWITAAVFILLFWQVGSALLLHLTLPFTGRSDSSAANGGLTGYSLAYFLVQLGGFLMLAGGELLAVRWILRVPLTFMITDSPDIRYGRIAASGFIWILLLTAATLIRALICGERIFLSAGLRDNPVNFLVFLPFALLLFPVQAASEEFLFRSLPGRWLTGTGTRRVIPVLISGGVFLAAHLGNPEAGHPDGPAAVLLYYFLFGALLMYLGLREGGWESAIGIHAGNNLFAALMVNYEGSVIPTPSLFVSASESPEAALSILAAAGGIMLVISILHSRRPQASEPVDTSQQL